MPRRQSPSTGLHANPMLTAAILDVVQNQLAAGTPPETKQTFERLVREGQAPEDAQRLIGCVVVSEIVEVLQRGEAYNEARFVAALQRLPQLPWER